MLLYIFKEACPGFFFIRARFNFEWGTEIFSSGAEKREREKLCRGGITHKVGNRISITKEGLLVLAFASYILIRGINILFQISSGAYAPYGPRLDMPLHI